jgi:hypothetical protein
MSGQEERTTKMEEEGGCGKRKGISLDPETKRKIALVKADPSKYPAVRNTNFLHCNFNTDFAYIGYTL